MDTAIERRRKVLRKIIDREVREDLRTAGPEHGFFIDTAVLTIQQWLEKPGDEGGGVPEFFGMVMLCEATRPGHWLLHGRWAHEAGADPHGLLTHESDSRLRTLLIQRGYQMESRLPNGSIEFWVREGEDRGRHAAH